MSKKLISLVLVLAVASMASAYQWDGPGSASTTAGNWSDAVNWNTDMLPGPADATTKINTGLGANIIVTSAVTAGIKPQLTSTPTPGTLVKLKITSTGSITNSGSLDGYTGSMDCVIAAGGVWNSCTTGGSYKMATNTAAGVVNSVKVDVYGTLNVKASTGTAALGMVNDTRSGTSGTNVARVIVRGGGLVDADNLVIGVGGVEYGDAQIQIAADGLLMLKGNVLSQVNAEILAGNIVGVGSSTPVAWYDGIRNKTIVPEPATLALLGLGSLTLLRRKR